MYEYLLQWGLKTLTKSAISSGQHEKDVLLEAIKTKNALVIERFKVAEKAANNLVQLTIEIETDLKKFRENYAESNPKEDFLEKLGSNFHPKFYREYRKIRPQFDITNDLLSGYTIGLSDWIHFSNVVDICKKNEITKPSDITRTYRMIWTFLLSTITRHLRLSTNDLRFWLTDKPYAMVAHKWMHDKEFPALREFFITGFSHEKVHYPVLESEKMLDQFWDEVGKL